MAYVFIDDGFPEAREYLSNYVQYDPRIPGDLQRAVRAHRATRRSRPAGLADGSPVAGPSESVGGSAA